MRHIAHDIRHAIYDMRHTLHVCGLIFLVLVTISLPAGAANEAADAALSIHSEVDKNQVNVGDRITLTLTAENAEGYEVLFPEVPEKLGDFSFVESERVKKKWYESERNEYEYVLTVFDPGIHVVPPVKVQYKMPEETVWRDAQSAQIPVDVESLLTKESKDIRDLKDIVSQKNGWRYIVLILLAVFGVIFAVWLLRRRRIKGTEKEKAKKRSAHEIAYTELQKLKAMNLLEKGLVKEYYVRLSDIVRHYLENRFSFRAPEMTTEEFLSVLAKSPKGAQQHKKLLKQFLVQCDMVKFAKYGPTQIEMLDSFRLAENFVDETKKIEEEDKK